MRLKIHSQRLFWQSLELRLEKRAIWFWTKKKRCYPGKYEKNDIIDKCYPALIVLHNMVRGPSEWSHTKSGISAEGVCNFSFFFSHSPSNQSLVSTYVSCQWWHWWLWVSSHCCSRPGRWRLFRNGLWRGQGWEGCSGSISRPRTARISFLFGLSYHLCHASGVSGPLSMSTEAEDDLKRNQKQNMAYTNPFQRGYKQFTATQWTNEELNNSKMLDSGMNSIILHWTNSSIRPTLLKLA